MRQIWRENSDDLIMEILIREEVNVYSIYIQINGTAVLNKRYHTHSSSGSGLEPQLTKSVFNQTDPRVRSSTLFCVWKAKSHNIKKVSMKSSLYIRT